MRFCPKTLKPAPVACFAAGGCAGLRSSTDTLEGVVAARLWPATLTTWREIMAGKKYRAAAEQIESNRLYTVPEAVELAKKIAYAKFDETVELDMTLGVDPRKADQMVRGTVVLPHGLGKSKRVVVIAGTPDKLQEAQEAGADEVGGDDIVTRIKGGWLDFDALIATPDMMRGVGQLGK